MYANQLKPEEKQQTNPFYMPNAKLVLRSDQKVNLANKTPYSTTKEIKNTILKQNYFKDAQEKYELNLGKYLYNKKESYVVATIALNALRNTLYDAYLPRYRHIEDHKERRLQFLLDTFTCNHHPYSSGQIGSDVGNAVNALFSSHMPNIDDPNYSTNFNAPANLRERMTAFFNASFYNTRNLPPYESANTVSLRNLLAAKNAEKAAFYQGKLRKVSNWDLRKSYFYSNQIKNLLSDPFDSQTILKDSCDESIDYYRDYLITSPIEENDIQFTREQFYQDRLDEGLKLSARERRYQMRFQRNDQMSPIVSGKMSRKIVPSENNNAQGMMDSGFRLVSGISCTTSRMLYSFNQAVSSDLDLALQFRGALMGWMLPEEDHSLYEILKGSHIVGVKGKEDMTDAETMDRTVSPLTEDELRSKVCEHYNGENLFPYEIALLKTVEENQL